ncbi:MAG: histidine phosphatase family protein [Micropruina sp.]
MPSVLILARHGQTEWNVTGRRQGQLDSPLTQEGVATAQRLRRVLSAQGIDVIATSPLGRARRTAAIFAEELDVDVVPMESLAEVHHGSFAGLTNDEIQLHHADLWQLREADFYGWRFPGGESYADADCRAARALEEVDALNAEMPLLVTHEMIGRMLRRHVLSLTLEQAFALRHPQAVAYRLEGGCSHVLT